MVLRPGAVYFCLLRVSSGVGSALLLGPEVITAVGSCSHVFFVNTRDFL